MILFLLKQDSLPLTLRGSTDHGTPPQNRLYGHARPDPVGVTGESHPHNSLAVTCAPSAPLPPFVKMTRQPRGCVHLSPLNMTIHCVKKHFGSSQYFHPP